MATAPKMTNRTRASLLLASVAASGIACAAHAGTITVCLDGTCDFADPVAAVNAAVSGDTVQIAAGTYLLASTVQAYGKELTIRGAVDAQGRPTTVLDGQGINTVLVALSVTDQTRFENLVITNGRADYGGGVFLSSANPVFRNCHLRNNSAGWHGGAMFLSQSSRPTLIACEITGNSAGNTQFPGQGRAGAVMVGDGTLTLIGCTVSGNSASGSGGALMLVTASTVLLESTRICGNSAPTDAQIAFNAGGGTVTEGSGACISATCNDCPVETPCVADISADRVVDGFDLGQVLSAWGNCAGCAADVNHDGIVNAVDLSVVLSGWGSCN
jgi:hypothetical protein